MSIYSELLDAVSNGSKFKVDLKNKSLWINRRKIIEKGELYEQNQGKELIKKWDLALDYGNVPLDENPWEVIKMLYDDYKHSVPGKNSNGKSYFKALPVEELTDAELAYNNDRDYSRAQFEAYVLLASLAGWITWDWGDYWFWQDTEDKELIILREWIENDK